MDILDGGLIIDSTTVPLAEDIITIPRFCTLVAVSTAGMVRCCDADCFTGARVIVVAIESISLKPAGVMLGTLLVTRGIDVTLLSRLGSNM